jgi:hypothetical protein
MIPAHPPKPAEDINSLTHVQELLEKQALWSREDKRE